MKEKVSAKIEEIVNYIISKPVRRITVDDYSILRDVRMEDENRERMEKLMSMAGGFSPVGNPPEVK